MLTLALVFFVKSNTSLISIDLSYVDIFLLLQPNRQATFPLHLIQLVNLKLFLVLYAVKFLFQLRFLSVSSLVSWVTMQLDSSIIVIEVEHDYYGLIKLT